MEEGEDESRDEGEREDESRQILLRQMFKEMTSESSENRGRRRREPR